MINTVKDRRNLYMRLEKLDLVGKLKPLLEKQGYILRPEDSLFVPRKVSVAYNAPWVYVKPDPMARCDLYHRIFFRVLGHIHSYCRSCWKVVVRPQNLEQLFDLYELQRQMGVPCKCGTEHRSTVCGHYGGYFYCRSKEEGLDRLDEVKKLYSYDVPIILKRYCTEFELEGVPSDELPDCTLEEREMEKYIETHFPRIGVSSRMPDHLIAAVMRRWIHHAYESGDETYKLFTGDEPLFKKYVTYSRDEVSKEE